MLDNEGEFADGISSLLNKEDSLHADCAMSILAETILLHRRWLVNGGK